MLLAHLAGLMDGGSNLTEPVDPAHGVTTLHSCRGTAGTGQDYEATIRRMYHIHSQRLKSKYRPLQWGFNISDHNLGNSPAVVRSSVGKEALLPQVPSAQCSCSHTVSNQITSVRPDGMCPVPCARCLPACGALLTAGNARLLQFRCDL